MSRLRLRTVAAWVVIVAAVLLGHSAGVTPGDLWRYLLH